MHSRSVLRPALPIITAFQPEPDRKRLPRLPFAQTCARVLWRLIPRPLRLALVARVRGVLTRVLSAL
jgi:hypothetical protein